MIWGRSARKLFPEQFNPDVMHNGISGSLTSYKEHVFQVSNYTEKWVLEVRKDQLLHLCRLRHLYTKDWTLDSHYVFAECSLLQSHHLRKLS